MSPGPTRVTEGDLEAALRRLLAASDREDPAAFLRELDGAEEAFAASAEPRWMAWRQALAARRGLVEGDAGLTSEAVAAAREALDKCAPSAETALTMAYLAHVEVTADHFDAAMLLAIDASLLTEGSAAGPPSQALLRAHLWLSLTLTALDLEELAVAQALRGHRVAGELPDLADRWRTLLLSAQQYTE